MSIDLTDLTEEECFYLKNYGIYNIKLNPESFMLRLRIAGGRINNEVLYFIAEIVQKYELDLLLTVRAQIELHGLNAKNILEVWELLQQKGISTLQTLTDNFRNIVSDPYDGLDESAKIEVYPLILEMQNIFLGKKEWMGMLPRKFNTAICGNRTSQVHFFANDLFFGLARKAEKWGFNLYLGGKNSEMAKDANIFVQPHEVPMMFEAVAKAYMQYGLRGSRSKTRLFHLISEIGMDTFVEKVSEFYPESLETKGVLQMHKALFTEFQTLKDQTFAYCYQSAFGKIDAAVLQELVSYVNRENCEVRIGVDQNLYLLGMKEKKVLFGNVPGASHVTACAGSRYCSLSLWDVKEETSYLPLEAIEAHNIQVGFSGCLKGCGKHYHADIGLVGLRTNLFGETQKAARVFLGGEYSRGEKAARLIFGVVPLVHLKSVFEVIIDEFEVSGEADFEDFSRKYLNPHSTFFLILWFLAKLYLKKQITLDILPEKELYQKLSAMKDFPKFSDDENYQKSIRVMLHSLWDDTTLSS